MKQAVAVYDLSRSAGWAVYSPTLAKPRHGILKLPGARTNGSVGPALKLLWEHIAWIDRNFGGILHLGYEAFLVPTGGKKDDDKNFTTSPRTTKNLVGFAGVAELCAEILEIGDEGIHSINNASWRSFWLGSQPRGTKRETWKALAVAKMVALGWAPYGDDDSDAVGQLHFLLHELGIIPPWKTDPRPSLLDALA
jgi:hypothetical protein